MKWISLFTVIIIIFLSSCSKVEEPEFRRVDNFRIINLGLEQVKVGFGMTYYNPNNFTVTVKETESDVYLDSVYIGRFVQDEPVEVNRKKDFTVLLTGNIRVADFLEMDLRDIHKREVLIRAEGNTKVGKAGIFVTRKIGYAGRHRLDMFRF